jgi:hypothetical protein
MLADATGSVDWYFNGLLGGAASLYKPRVRT